MNESKILEMTDGGNAPTTSTANGTMNPPSTVSRSPSGVSHDTTTGLGGGSISSHHSVGSLSQQSQSQQTRFSFYNADDFKVKSIVESTTLTTTNSNNSPPSSALKKAKSPKTLKLQQVVSETVNSGDQQKDADLLNEETNINSNANSIDSNEILRSLQEHEQQRIDILSGPKSLTGTSGSQHSYHTQESISNPYEEAIKEALQLIRKHRTPIISEPLYNSETLQQPSISSSAVGNNQVPVVRKLPSIESQNMENNDDDTDTDPAVRSITREFHELMARSTRSLPDIGSAQQHNNFTTTTPTTSNGVTDTGLGEAYQAEIEARRRQRQERMARYASRLAELKQGGEDHDSHQRQLNEHAVADDNDDGIPAVDTARSLDSSVDYGSAGIGYGVVNTRYRSMLVENHEPGVTTSRSWEDDILLSRSHSQEGAGGIVASNTNASVSTITNTLRHDDEVQRGVERVLLAILERANNSRGRTTTSAMVDGRLQLFDRQVQQPVAISGPMKELPPPHDNIGTDRRRATEEKKPINNEKSNDVLVQAMTELLAGPNSNVQSTQVDHDLDFAVKSNLNGVGNYASHTMPGIEVMDRKTTLQLRPEDSIAPEAPLRKEVEDPSISDYNQDDEYTEGREEEVDDQDEGSEFDVDDSASYDEEGDEEEDDDDDVTRSEYDSNPESENYETARVLGPLNKRSGGTTGVVLDEYSSASSASYEDKSADGAPQATSILDSLSAAVSRVTGISKSDEVDHSGRSGKDKYNAMDDIESDEESEDDESTDSEANDLMRSLCAHLLPVSVERTRRILDDVPEWDESNPDEAGYRIVRLTSFQLRSIEKEYDRLIESLQVKSQIILSPKAGVDNSAFEIDLQAAEKLLEEEELKLRNVEKVQSAEGIKSQSGDMTSPVIENLPIKKFDEAECLDCFPGVKPTGKGEMGDLEYFSLPIIFKSHVTGFEPTKDIILEPGNVVAGQYLVEGVLGSAAFSTAYKCVDMSSEEDSTGCQDLVCLKVIKNTKDFFDQSLDEIKILELLRQTGKCNEKFIVEMKTFFYHREHLIIVTELLRQNLFEFGKFIIDSGEEPYFTLSRLSYIARQCLIALEFVHGMGLVHSDVKPENILLSSYSRAQAKLIDFGSSCYLTDRQSSYIQSRSYRAPEVVLGLPYDGRIDIWSIGCVIAEMFTGEVTFQNDSVVSMLSRIEAICGPFPRHMITQGRQSARFFSKCGLLFEKVIHENSENTDRSDSASDNSSYEEDVDNHRRLYIDIFQPKHTTLAARLGFAPDLMDKFDNQSTLSAEEQRQAIFCDLIRKLLIIDPELRLTATEALNHPAMIYAATLTEADIKYPSP